MKTWTMAISVDDTWVEDGFDLTPQRLKDAVLDKLLPFAEDHEVTVEVANPASLLGSKGGKSTSEAKRAAARANGKKRKSTAPVTDAPPAAQLTDF